MNVGICHADNSNDIVSQYWNLRRPKVLSIMTHVLVVDDDELSRDIIIKMLQEMENITFAEAQDGEEALVMMQEQPFDLVILDILMPNEDGIGVLLKARNRGVETPIVVMTGATMGESGPSYSQYAERLGAKKGLEKPITMDKVKKAISYAL